jgi:hypothetical protein
MLAGQEASMMGKTYSLDLRKRLVAAIEMSTGIISNSAGSRNQ